MKPVLVAMATYNRLEMTKKTLEALYATTKRNLYDLYIYDNASTDGTAMYLSRDQQLYKSIEMVFWGRNNIGTARAINHCWTARWAGQHAIKMDNDVVIKTYGWLGMILEALEAAKKDCLKIGIVGLKRKDLEERPDHPNPWYRSELITLSNGMVIEECQHIMGTCQLYTAEALKEFGYLVQPHIYGFDDALASVRMHVLGYKTVFLHGVEIDHIDPGGTPYQDWKEKEAGIDMRRYFQMKMEYESGVRSPYEEATL